MESQVLSGYEDKNGDIYVEFLLADGDVLNKSIVNGLPLGYTSELLEKWHNERAWEGVVHNAHPSKNHPLVYEGQPPSYLAESSQVAWAKDRSNKWGFANYIKTKLKTLDDGRKRLLGTIHIIDEKAKRAWREGKFPKFASSSVYIQKRDANGFVTEGIPISCTSVEKPSYPLDVAGIHNECHGGNECVHKIAESGYNCNDCKYDLLTSFENIFSSNSIQKVSESSMTEDSKPTSESDVKPAIQEISNETRSADGTLLEQKTEEVDWKARFEALDKEHKKAIKEHTDYKTTTDERFTKIEKEKLETKIRSIVEKVPLNLAFEGKEENREAEVKKWLKRYNGKNDSEIIEDVNDKFMIALKVKSSGKVGESGQISNEARLVPSADGKPDARILKAHEVFS